MVQDKGVWDKVKGKFNQATGEARDKPTQKMKGHAQEAKGEMKEAISDADERV